MYDPRHPAGPMMACPKHLMMSGVNAGVQAEDKVHLLMRMVGISIAGWHANNHHSESTFADSESKYCRKCEYSGITFCFLRLRAHIW
jgi:hypothetical protein